MLATVADPGRLIRGQRLVMEVRFLVVHMPCGDEALHEHPNDDSDRPHEDDDATQTRRRSRIRVDGDHLEGSIAFTNNSSEHSRRGV